MRSLFRRPPHDLTAAPTVAGQPARVPPGACVYAVGDIHGRADLLREMHRLIAEDAATLTPGTSKFVVYLGDYVDRGLESRRVVDLLINDPLQDFQAVHLLGNHDAWLLSFLVDPAIGQIWLRYGGDATMHSYGVQFGTPQDDPRFYEQLQSHLRQRIPRRHVEFLQSLELSFQSGDYVFVHAGVDPARPLHQQTADDLLWIREPFLSCRTRSGLRGGAWSHRRIRADRAGQSDRNRHGRLLDRLSHLPGARGERFPVSDHRRPRAGSWLRPRAMTASRERF